MTKPKSSMQEIHEKTRNIHDGAMHKMGVATGSFEELKFLGMAVAEEGGEVAGAVKKLWRDGHSAERYDNLLKECADVIMYMSHLLNHLGKTEHEVVEFKLQELRTRWPEYFQKGDVAKHESWPHAEARDYCDQHGHDYARPLCWSESVCIRCGDISKAYADG